MENKSPIGGYAPGNYYCTCATCDKKFQGDKRAVQCEACAIYDKERFDAMTPEEQKELVRRNSMIAHLMFVYAGAGDQIVANQLSGMAIEEAIFQAGYSSGYENGYERGKREVAPTGAVWVKGANRFPVKKHVIAKMFIGYLNREVVGTASSATGEMICFDWGMSSVCLAIGHEELNNLVWLDENAGEKDEWIRVEDRLPTESGRYWCYVEEITDLGRGYFQWNCAYSQNGKIFTDRSLCNGERITHWRPLPEPPKRSPEL